MITIPWSIDCEYPVLGRQFVFKTANKFNPIISAIQVLSILNVIQLPFIQLTII